MRRLAARLTRRLCRHRVCFAEHQLSASVVTDEDGVRFLGHALLKRMLDCFLSKRICWSVRGKVSESCEGCELSKEHSLQLIRDIRWF